MFERFTERARQVVVLAQEEARKNKQAYIGAEHILLGLLREEEGLAARILASLDVTIEKARESVEARATGRLRDEDELAGQIPFTPRARKALELSLREALSLGHNYIGTEHVLLGIIRERDNVAVEILMDDFKTTTETIRGEVIRMLSGPKAPILKKDGPDAPPRPLHESEAVRVKTLAPEAREQVVGQITEQLREHKRLRELLEDAVLLGRQYPERPADKIANAVVALHA